MSNLITSDYFDLDTNIPESDYSIVEDAIAKYEPEILIKALGYTLYEFVAAYANPGSAQRIIDLVEGKIYEITSGGVTYKVKWNGLKNTDQISLIAYYVYFHWQKNNATQTMYVGEIKPALENAEPTSVAQKMSAAWLRLKKLYGYPGQDSREPSLYNFLTEHESNYPEWIYSMLGSVNNWDL